MVVFVVAEFREDGRAVAAAEFIIARGDRGGGGSVVVAENKSVGNGLGGGEFGAFE